MEPDSTSAAIVAPAAESNQSALDVRAWLVWAGAATVTAMFMFNPWYQAVLIGIVLLGWPGDSRAANQGFLRLGLLARIGAVSLLFGGAFNLLTVHYGETVLFRLPAAIPLAGGPATAESLVYGLINALRLVTLLFIFALFSRSVNYADLLRLAPSALFELGLIVSIGFTLVPFTLRSFAEIREAQALRGHRMRGIRDLFALFKPLVVSGMEHALALAESMEARGYGGVRLTRRVWIGQGLALGSLVGLIVLMAVHTFAPLPTPVFGGLLLGVGALMAVALRQLSAGAGRTRLRHGHWGWPETAAALGALLPLGMILVIDRSLLVYDAYRLSALGWPAFNPWIGAALLGLAIPAISRQPSARKNTDDHV